MARFVLRSRHYAEGTSHRLPHRLRRWIAVVAAMGVGVALLAFLPDVAAATEGSGGGGATGSVAPPAESEAPVADEVALPEESTETSNTWLEPDGRLRTEIASGPINFADASGEWQPIDNDLVPSDAAGVAVENAANDFTARLPRDASEKGVRYLAGGAWVSFKMHGLDGAPDVAGSSATYSDVEDASEVTYQTTATALKESIVLEAAPAAPVSYAWGVSDPLCKGVTSNLNRRSGSRVRKRHGRSAGHCRGGTTSARA
jgi:hypothetical protein